MTIQSIPREASHGKLLRVYGIAMGVSRLMMRTYNPATLTHMLILVEITTEVCYT